MSRVDARPVVLRLTDAGLLLLARADRGRRLRRGWSRRSKAAPPCAARSSCNTATKTPATFWISTGASPRPSQQTREAAGLLLQDRGEEHLPDFGN